MQPHTRYERLAIHEAYTISRMKFVKPAYDCSINDKKEGMLYRIV